MLERLEDGNWLNPDEIETNNGKDYFIKNNQSKKVFVGAAESMSKSKKNTINPQDIIENYGADAVRIFILSDSPPEKDIQWSEQGMVASYKFINKFWMLDEKLNQLFNKKPEEKSNDIEVFINQIINKIELAIENFKYNLIIAVFHEIYAFLFNLTKEDKNYSNLNTGYQKILTVMVPIIPHLASECLNRLGKEKDLSWPILEKEFLQTNDVEIVIQINGKKRNSVTVEKNLSKDTILTKILESNLVDKHLKGKDIVKTIYVENRLINIIFK